MLIFFFFFFENLDKLSLQFNLELEYTFTFKCDNKIVQILISHNPCVFGKWDQKPEEHLDLWSCDVATTLTSICSSESCRWKVVVEVL